MNRRDLLKKTISGAGSAIAVSGLVKPDPGITATSKPNILQIMRDQQIWASIAGRSECRTPNINRLTKNREFHLKTESVPF